MQNSIRKEPSGEPLRNLFSLEKERAQLQSWNECEGVESGTAHKRS